MASAGIYYLASLYWVKVCLFPQTEPALRHTSTTTDERASA